MGNKKIKIWLANRQRKYADGLALFLEFATPEFKKKYEAYFSKVTDEPDAFDPHFTMLINKLTVIDRILDLQQPKTVIDFTPVPEVDRVLGIKEVKANDEEETKLSNELKEKESELDSLRKELEESKESDEDKQDRIDDLESEIEEKESEIDELKEKIENFRKGVKVVKEDDLPEHLLSLYQRIKEITPLYAALKTEIADENLSDDERKKKAEELCALDDERRKAWNTIDDWAAGEEVRVELKGVDPDEDLSDDPFVKGLQISKAIERAKENLKRSKAAVTSFTKSGDLNKANKAQSRVDKYQVELNKLTELMKNAPKN